MKRKTALHFSKDLQSVLDDFVKDNVYMEDQKMLRVAIPKKWNGRALAFDKYIKKGNHRYGFKIDTFYPNCETGLLYHSYKDGIMYFTLKPPYKKSDYITVSG